MLLVVAFVKESVIGFISVFVASKVRL